jgi:DNA mismatch repair protein MutL
VAKVQVLPQVLAHQIAAGEVVERPASVVKELVENSLDAGASRIVVSVKEGGRRLIQVWDDGCGMSADDAKLAFQHHATSKISSFDDLQSIRTLGFRGEALPSIASVSRTCLRTVDEGSTAGIEILYQGGELESVQEISWVRGTELVVEDLFFNVPARQKFLKTVATELSHISRQVCTCLS